MAGATKRIAPFGICLVLSVCFLNIPANCQENTVYTTKKGSMRLLLQKEDVDTTIVAETSGLTVQLDYDVPKIQFKAELDAFQCSDTLVRNCLRSIANPMIRFKGDMQVRSLDQQNQSKIIFPIEGALYINGKREYVKLTGNLFPMQYANNYQAQLHVNTELTLSQFGLKQYLPGYRDRFYVLIRQSVLRPQH
jgi:hypothetical protein